MVRYASGSGEFQNLIVFLVILYFDECLDFIDEAKGLGGVVLLHCFVGRSRSLISPPRQTGLVVVCEHLTWVVSAQETHKVRGKTPAAVLPLLQ
ncbi:hypothetical protein NE237_016329 [Protea cynaroides]|uniref:Uncharacterized protein n=1 Tax=Protea cynaroides TaxID=273540 RepID=A0A9Q0GNW1_9MAGN|nr:hypothetical protein NE237_016329 [Protea cynaroides]